MGAAIWLTSALSIFFVAKTVPPGRERNYLTELFVAIAAALVFGVIATALDFGGWRDTDWRAALFVLLGVTAATAAQRALRLARNLGSNSERSEESAEERRSSSTLRPD